MIKQAKAWVGRRVQVGRESSESRRCDRQVQTGRNGSFRFDEDFKLAWRSTSTCCMTVYSLFTEAKDYLVIQDIEDQIKKDYPIQVEGLELLGNSDPRSQAGIESVGLDLAGSINTK